MEINQLHPNSSLTNRKVRQDFKRRYKQMTNDECRAFDKNVDILGRTVGGILFIVLILFIILKVLFS